MPVYKAPFRGVTRSEAMAEAMATANAEDAVLYTLEITHPDLASPIRVVLSDADVTATLETGAPVDPGASVLFRAVNMTVKFPEESDASPKPSTIFVLDGVSSLVAPELDPLASSLQPVVLRMRTYLSTDLTGPAVLPPLELELKDITLSEFTVSFSAAFSGFTSFRFPGKSFLLDEYPTLAAR